jgi:hypothetical protein
VGACNFTTLEPGTHLQTCFRSAQDAARAERGHQEGYSGDIQTKTRVVLRRSEPLTDAEADRFIFGTGAAAQDDGDLERATKYGPCFAVPIRADAVPDVIGYRFYGQARC